MDFCDTINLLDARYFDKIKHDIWSLQRSIGTRNLETEGQEHNEKTKLTKSLFELKGGLDPSTDLDKLNLNKTKRSFLERKIRGHKKGSFNIANR